MTNSARIPASRLMRHVTMEVRITGVRALRVRLWAAKLLIRLSAVVAGTNVEIR